MPRRLTLDAPLECTIRAAGALDARWSERLGGLRVRPAGRGSPVAELRGPLRDQAALFGVLATLYDLGLPVLSIPLARRRLGAAGALVSAAGGPGAARQATERTGRPRS